MQLDSGACAFVVGDVAGHGARAAADMAMIRGIITALLETGTAPSDVFGHASAILMRRPDLLLVTVALAVVDCVNDAITFATAGHPPPLIRYPDGNVVALDAAGSPMLGIGAVTGKADTAAFPPRSRMLVYTDGLVERRDRPFDVGIAKLAATLSRVKGPPAACIDAVVEALLGDGAAAEDDVALLVVERLP
jgi:serine phosphatase RsbU (regulator of sigma subunit)